MTLKVVDLFCGGGGLSEGFRQAGFDVILGLDNNQAACDTFSKNHKGSQAIKTDLSNFDVSELPDCDVLIGGPPCVEFSASNKAGNGNILDGLKLVQVFLQAVHVKKPKYWLMENVLRITKFLPDEFPLSWIGVDEEGMLQVPTRSTYNTADYGVPQARKRFIMGNYPLPLRSHASPKDILLLGSRLELEEHGTLGEVLTSLPSPLSKEKGGVVDDFNYDIELPVSELTDHFYDARMPDEECDRIRRAKTLHPFYGLLEFPDRLDRPARTVVATQLGRETLVVRDERDPEDKYRRATIRECAVLQSFPITYQFYGNNYSSRYRLVGDAVPPKLSFSIANKILEAEGQTPLTQPLVEHRVIERSTPIGGPLNRPKKKRNLADDRKFREFVPGKEMRGCRADFDNYERSASPILFDVRNREHPLSWSGRLIVGEGSKGKNAVRDSTVNFEDASAELLSSVPKIVSCEKASSFFQELSACVVGLVPDATTLQSVWTEKTSGTPSPYEITDALSLLVNKHFSKGEFEKCHVGPNGHLPLSPKKGVRIRILAGLVAASFAAAEANDGWKWARKNQPLVFPEIKPEDLADGTRTQHERVLERRLKQIDAIRLER